MYDSVTELASEGKKKNSKAILALLPDIRRRSKTPSATDPQVFEPL